MNTARICILKSTTLPEISGKVKKQVLTAAKALASSHGAIYIELEDSKGYITPYELHEGKWWNMDKDYPDRFIPKD